MELQFVPTELPDIFTKLILEERLILLWNQLGIDYVNELLISKCLYTYILHPKDIHHYIHD